MCARVPHKNTDVVCQLNMEHSIIIETQKIKYLYLNLSDFEMDMMQLCILCMAWLKWAHFQWLFQFVGMCMPVQQT